MDILARLNILFPLVKFAAEPDGSISCQKLRSGKAILVDAETARTLTRGSEGDFRRFLSEKEPVLSA